MATDCKNKFCAHIRQDGTEQSVTDHCISVAKRAETYGKLCNMESLSYIAGLYHDVGKFSDEFNGYIHDENNYTRGEIDHAYAGAKYLYEKYATDENNITEAVGLISRVIVSHHAIHDWRNLDHSDYFGERINKNDFFDQIKNEIKNQIGDNGDKIRDGAKEIATIDSIIANMLTDLRGEKKATAKAFYYGLCERLLQSVLMDADRIDTAEFMSSERMENDYDIKNIFQSSSQNLHKKLLSFQNVNKVNKIRQDIFFKCEKFADNDVGIARLIVPTGGGKTLSSMAFALKYALRMGKQKIIYVAPYTSILEQNSAVLKEIFGDCLLEHYSDATINNSNQTKEEFDDYELRCEMWDSPAIATTMVQFLNTLFLANSASVRRFHRLCKSVIILDEVQSIPTCMLYPFNLAINFLSKVCDTTIVLCSATQPPLEKLDYPLLLDNPSMTGDCEQDFNKLSRAKIIPDIQKEMTCDEAAQYALQKFSKAGNLLFVANTKKSALNIYKAITASDTAQGVTTVYLSTSLCPEHRRQKINTVKDLLKAGKPVICVTTQLIEAGVDISFKCVVRALAGMDNAAQAAGRCNRNGEEKGICPVYLIYLSDENLQSLKDIDEARALSDEFLNSYEGQDVDYSFPQYMNKYYAMSFKRKLAKSFNAFSYPIKQPPTNLLDLLSVNRYYNVDGVVSYHSQAFRTAGENFKAIDSGGMTVYVQFNDEAKALIEDLKKDLSPKQALNIERRLQKYTVTIYKSDFDKLCDFCAIEQLPQGEYILDEGYYDENFGVITEKQIMKYLNF